MTATAKTRSAYATDDYLHLIRAFPLRPLRSDDDFAEALRILSRLLGRPDGKLTSGERNYVDVVGSLVEEHGRQSHRLPRRKQSPLEMLRFLVSEHGMNVAALGAVLGNKTAASLVLSGKRELSKSHIRRLAEHFKVDAGLFI